MAQQTPDPKLIESMALRYRHDFWLLDELQKEPIRTTMKQLWEEVVGLGFYKPRTEQQTAMEQFIEWISSDCTPLDCVIKAKELLKTEREQRFKDFKSGQDSMKEGGRELKINLPSDEEIEKAANSQSHYEGAMWIKYKILNQNK